MKKCEICGKEYNEKDYIEGSIRSIMEEKHYCFNCAFWEEKVREADEDTFVVNNTRYHGSLVDKNKVKGFLGFGGADFYVKFNDGRIRHYNNVWCQGDVPEIWREKIPNNATFLTKEEYEKLQK